MWSDYGVSEYVNASVCVWFPHVFGLQVTQPVLEKKTLSHDLKVGPSVTNYNMLQLYSFTSRFIFTYGALVIDEG